MINGEKNTISNVINIMIQSFKNAIENNDVELLKFPSILPLERIEVIGEQNADFSFIKPNKLLEQLELYGLQKNSSVIWVCIRLKKICRKVL